MSSVEAEAYDTERKEAEFKEVVYLRLAELDLRESV